MSDNAFLVTLNTITSGGLQLGELIEAASALSRSGQSPQAQELYRVWAKFNAEHPQVHVAHFNCAVLQSDAGNLAAAALTLNEAIKASPDFLPAYINLGGVLERGGAVDQGLEQWKAMLNRLSAVTGSAVEFKITALKQIARVLADHQKLELGETVLHEALTLNPSQRDVTEQYMSLRMSQCKWPAAAPFANVAREVLVGGIHPLSLNAYSDDPLLQLGAAARYAEQLVDEKPELLAVDRRDERIDLTGRRLRVGYVSSDLRDHAVGYLMAEMLELHDRAKVEVFAYYCGVPASGGLNARIMAAVEHWTDIRGMTDDAAARQIAEDGIDVLVDVNGHTRDARSAVFARRPAPIIVNWLGYPGTMGTPYHHYIVADEWVIPPESEIYYSEKVLRLPCYQSNDRKRIVAPERPARAEAGLPDDAFVFCCFNAAHKITRFTFERWAQIMQRTPGSVLWLLESTPETMARLRVLADEYGIGADRLIFAPKQHNPQHLARYPLADLFLDTSPYGAHTTASDALFMGVPVLTFAGRCFASRVCASLVRAAGLPDLICDSPAAYVERAVALAADPAAIADLKARLERNRDTCVLFDMDRLTAGLEDLYFQMCAEQARGELPQPDLSNLEAYYKIGVQHEHEVEDLTVKADYHEAFRARLAERHRLRPLQADQRLWTAADIAAAEARPGQAAEAAPRRKRAAA
ncbi:N-acetylglucosamine transferase [Phenylobacterium hankyongense]|uniref:N-acetylglucosamine transferase n=1 Tax=Phenylobacterium hankyongense TaxID=1813876 RepID=A0A328B5P7_9CAUL|nr:N-acetylglucosamine transferase [Phenylobacterium hankyongense]RAK60368.1 N-acetylglucosamine transferase [Phenylobacterium hankyongense]